MFNLDFSRIVLATVGTLFLTTLSVGAAVGPARAVETATVAIAQAPVAEVANV
jgi:hypothetical protein